MSSSLPIRPEFADKKPYGAPQFDVPIRLNTNENPFPHNNDFVQKVTNSLASTISSANRYPDRDAIELREKLSSYLAGATGVKLNKEQIWAANGSNEILLQLFQLFGGPDRFALGFEPSYSMHPIISELTHTKWVSLPRTYDFEIEFPENVDLVKNASLVLVCTPNNPSGNVTSLDLISRLHNATDGVVVVDEAYAEFSNRPSAVTLLANHPRLVVVRTMSKAFGFAGVRLGYLAGSVDLVTAIQLVRLPYHLSSITQKTAIAALDTAEELRAKVNELVNERNRMIFALRECGLRVIDSQANFLLFGQFSDPEEVWKFLLERGILIRDVGIFGMLRVTCGSVAENTEFLAAMTEYLELTKQSGEIK